MRQYREPGFVSHATRVSADTYGLLLDNVVVCCVDCVLVHQGDLLLGSRLHCPYQGWWVMGGRMQPGESYEMTAQRVVEQEVGLRIEDLERFRYIDTACYVWDRREQPPQGHGCHMEGNNFLVEISDEERARVWRSSPHFGELRWAAPTEVLRDLATHRSIQFLAAYVREHCART